MFNEMVIYFYIIGVFIGSFLNVIAYRVPRGESFVLPPSHCPRCQHQLRPWDLVPLFSFLSLRGRCRYCQTKISWRYPLVEIVTGLITFIWWQRIGLYEFNLHSIVLLIFSYVLIVIALIDWDCQIIPDKIVIPCAIAGLIYQAVGGNLWEGLLGLTVGGGLLLLIYLFYSRGMGLGDVKLLAMAGTYIGWEKAIVVLFLGSLIGLLMMLPLFIVHRLSRKTPFAFGPFLVIAILIVIYRWDLFVKFFSFLPR